MGAAAGAAAVAVAAANLGAAVAGDDIEKLFLRDKRE
jgi:hypothetical protein